MNKKWINNVLKENGLEQDRRALFAFITNDLRTI